MQDKPYLKEIELVSEDLDFSKYPLSIPAIKSIFNNPVKFHPDVTFIVGENGAGKSTLIEGVAIKLGFNPEGGTKQSTFSTRTSHSNLHKNIKAIKSYKAPKDGYFLRAESFYNLATLMDETNYLSMYGGKSLHSQSHGESFMSTLINKLQGEGLYIFDEPESALSPSGQLSALIAIDNLVKKSSQFIIATHSPILMAYPNSKILYLDDNGINEILYEDTDHFKITKSFLNNPEDFITKLLLE